MALASEPDFSRPTASLPDVTSTTTPTAFADLPAGPTNGILVTAPDGNAVTIRVSGSDVLATRGQPLAAGTSYTFTRENASKLWHCTESGTGKLHVTAV